MDSACDAVIVGAAHTDLQIYPVTRDIADTVSWPAKTMVWTVGGDAINEATVLTRLGHRVRLVSCIGDDAAGSIVLEHCRENGIDTSWLKRDPAKTTGINVGLIWEDGERTFINNRSGSVWTFEPADVDMDAVRDAKILSFASIFNNPLLDESLMMPLFTRAKEQGMTICADMVASKRSETLADIERVLPFVDFFFPNYEEARVLTSADDMDDIADVLLGLGVKNVVLKIGKRGCLLKNASRRVIVPAYPRADCVDTTGAGDSFASGFISGLLEGRDLEECAQMANCAASLAIEAIGATAGVSSREKLDRRFRDWRACFQTEQQSPAAPL